jgi:hypothetical protein
MYAYKTILCERCACTSSSDFRSRAAYAANILLVAHAHFLGAQRAQLSRWPRADLKTETWPSF